MNLIFSVLFTSQLVLSSLHPLHVSVTEIEYDEKEKELEIMVRVFTDDLEKAVRQQRNEPALDILHPTGEQTTDKLLEAYLNKQLSVSLDNKVQPVHYLGHEEEGEAIVCYIQVARIKSWKTIRVSNTMLMEIYDDQSNLVHVTVRGTVKSLRLLNNNRQGELTFTSK